MYSLSESSELDIVTRAGGEPREDSDRGVIGVGGVSGDGGTGLSCGEGNGERGEGGRDSGRATLTGEAVGKGADSVVRDMEAAVRSMVTRRVMHVETGSPDDEEVRRLSRLAAGMQNRQ